MRIWFKRRKKGDSPVTTLVSEPEDKVILHGHDLDKWNYLGYITLKFLNEHKEVTSKYPTFLFASKTNDKRRSYHIANQITDYVEKIHTYVSISLKPWAAGEGEVYHLIMGEDSNPSDYLKEYMLDRFGAEWDTETNWWGTTDKAKYNSAKNKQKRERKEKPKAETAPETNIVTVDFGKQS